MERDGNLESLWQQAPVFAEKQAFNAGGRYDVLVVGGGITGLTTALLLQQKGRSCIVPEAHTIGFGTTLGTSAHLNNFFDTPFNSIAKNFGEDEAKLVYQGAEAALAHIKNNIDQLGIECGYSTSTGYLYAQDEDQLKMLEDIVEGGKKVGLPISYTNEKPFPIPGLAVASVEGQARFNPAQYIAGLATAFEAAGGVLLQHCTVQKTHDGETIIVETTSGEIKTSNVVYATHIPPGVNVLHFRCAPYRSYVMAVTLASGQYPDELGYDLQDPYHYYRSQEVEGKNYFLVGGEDHKTGHIENTAECFRKLESHVRTHFDVESVAFRWSSQYFEPADGLPYIGKFPGSGSNVYVATGFGGNGLTYGTLAGILLADLLTTGSSKYEKLFDPGRVKPIAAFKNVVKEGADVVKTFVTGKFSHEKIEAIAELAANEGKIIKYEGKTMGLYKDNEHRLFAVDPTCPHVACNVAWNAAELSWDCPCHGSRFSITGELLTGPAQTGLEKIVIAAPEKG